MPGVKHDEAKPRYDLIPPEAEEALAQVLTYGAKKYAPNNWRVVDRAPERYYAAARRHMNAWRRGEVDDPESGLPHTAHAMCCLLFLLTFDLEDKNVGA